MLTCYYCVDSNTLRGLSPSNPRGSARDGAPATLDDEDKGLNPLFGPRPDTVQGDPCCSPRDSG